MKAVVLESPGKLVYTDVDKPAPGLGQVVVQVKAASICGSDVLRVGHGHAKTYPLILGHECAGVIVEVGAGVDRGLLGRHVSIAPLIPCMNCDACRAGLYASCERYSFIGSRIAGAFAEYVLVPRANIIPLPEGLDFELGALIEPLTVALHSLERGGGAKDKTVAVFGAGMIGLLVVQMARATGARKIIAVDLIGENLEAAALFGADVTLNPTSGDVTAEIERHTGRGVDLALEVSGAPQAVQSVIAATRPGGDVVFVGNQPKDRALSTNLIEEIMRRQLNLHGAWMSYSAPFPGHEWAAVVELINAGKLPLRQMITHHIGLPDLPGMIAQMDARTVSHRKVVVQP